MSDEDLRAYEFLVRYLDHDVRAQTGRMRPSDTVGLIVNKAVEGAGLELPPDSFSWRELEIAFLKAQRDAFDGIRKRLEGGEVDTP